MEGYRAPDSFGAAGDKGDFTGERHDSKVEVFVFTELSTQDFLEDSVGECDYCWYFL